MCEMVCVDFNKPNSVSALLSVNCGTQGAGAQHVLDLPGAHIQLFVSTVVSSPDNISFKLL